MGYLKDFQTHIANHDYPSFLKLWEEYCSGDEVDPGELREILRGVKTSEIAEPVGRHVERIIPLWKILPESPVANEILKLIIDIQTTNSEQCAELVMDYLKTHYPDDKHFNDKLRLIGMRNREKFQGALSNYELLTHMAKGKYVFHTGGWGVGEIIDVSPVREQLSIEFDYVPGKKEMSFATAFKNLIPIPDDHFLALRFGNPDLLEQKAKENAVEVIRMLLRDLGPKTAAEIKDELCDLVIPANEWTRWWQNARAKVKKDTMIETPDDIREPFRIRESEVTHEERLQKVLENKPDANTLIQMVYSFLKDFPEMLKNGEFKETLISKLTEMLGYPEISRPQELQLHFFLQDLKGEKEYPAIGEVIAGFESILEALSAIEVLTFKKRVLTEVRKYRANWREIFLDLLFKVDGAPLRDYILGELLTEEGDPELKKALESLYTHPARHPDAFLWYFQKLSSQKAIPFSDKEGKTRFFEGLLILLSHIENHPEQRDLVKKIHNILSGDRFAVVRQRMQEASAEDVREFLLLASKCHSLSDHDQKIFHSLAEVAHPSLAKARKKGEVSSQDAEVLWTTREGYQKLQHRIQQIATVETVENAKEIEVARSHGDLRENAEFKAALERRDRLQSELKTLSDQLGHARVITKEDISTEEVGIGNIVDCENSAGKTISFTLLGPWDADPEKNILSFQSKLAQAMRGKGVGDSFQMQGENYTITAIRSYLNPSQ
ncbi:MAG: GreA/GreB family elongation factor [Verrucomicrobia bacterium]|nr:GreA/GreB family elongation factor [Verrucomicrobiota bacterium]